MYKIANNIAPVYLTDLFQMRNIISDSLVSNLRSVTNSNFVIPRPQVHLFKSSLSYSGPVIWNNTVKREIFASSNFRGILRSVSIREN